MSGINVDNVLTNMDYSPHLLLGEKEGARAVDMLQPDNQIIQQGYPVTPVLYKIDPTSVPSLGGKATFKLPEDIVSFGEMSLNFALSALATGTYCNNVGFAATNGYTHTCGSIIDNNNNYRETQNYYVNEQPEEKKDELIDLAGGSTYAGGPLLSVPVFAINSKNGAMEARQHHCQMVMY